MKRIAFLLACLGTSVSVHAQTVTDLGTSGVEDNGSLQGTAVLTADARYGSGAVSLPPGDDNIVKLTQPVTDLDMADSYTYMTWFKADAAGEKGLIGLGNCCAASGGDARNGYTMNLTGGSTIRYWAGSTPNNNNHNLYTGSLPVLVDGNWHHVAIRVQPGQVDIFVDGVLQASNDESNIPTQPSLASENANSTNVPKIGGDGISEGSSADVVIDEVRVYGSALSDQGIMDAMNNAGPLPDRLYYTFDDDTVLSDGLLRVQVTKTFSDGNDDEVEVTLTCNSGLPLEQSFTIAGGGPGVVFVVEELPDDEEVTCTVTETGSASGYTPVFNGGDGCSWTGVLGGLRTCEITNDLETVDYVVNKEWEFTEADTAIPQDVYVDVRCENFRTSPDGQLTSGNEAGVIDADDGTLTFSIYPNWTTPATRCRTIETQIDNAIESDQGCADWLTLAPGGDEQSCTITNTVFFEGIPTLSQWGMALMALLMLGVGFIGLRRFV